MPTNQFLPFGLAGGAYVYNYATYLALPQRLTGYPPGLAPKEWANTALRQSAFVASSLSEHMAELTGEDILDNGVRSDWIDQYRLAQRNEVAEQRYPLDTGAGNAYVVALDPPVTAKVHGMDVAFIATHSNTGASTFNVGAGASPLVRADGTALYEQDIPAGSTVTAIYDLVSDKWTIYGVLINAINRASAWRYITAPTQLSVGSPYAVNTLIVGSFDVTLPANPVVGDSLTFVDPSNNWGQDTFTILRNGHTIMTRAEDLIVNVSDQMFSIWFDESNDWRLV